MMKVVEWKIMYKNAVWKNILMSLKEHDKCYFKKFETIANLTHFSLRLVLKALDESTHSAQYFNDWDANLAASNFVL